MRSNAYNAVQKETVSGRALEREVFSRITRRLESADVGEAGGVTSFYQALQENKKLWLTLAVDLAKPTNQCTDDLRASLLSLAHFVERHTAKVMAGEADHQILAEINQNIIQGLSGSMDEAA